MAPDNKTEEGGLTQITVFGHSDACVTSLAPDRPIYVRPCNDPAYQIWGVVIGDEQAIITSAKFPGWCLGVNTRTYEPMLTNCSGDPADAVPIVYYMPRIGLSAWAIIIPAANRYLMVNSKQTKIRGDLPLIFGPPKAKLPFKLWAVNIHPPKS
jgi:hypothetical protein